MQIMEYGAKVQLFFDMTKFFTKFFLQRCIFLTMRRGHNKKAVVRLYWITAI